MALWTAKDVATATGGTLHGGDAWVANGFAMDSRKIQPGDIFLALPGEKVDGHNFLDAALKAGAAAAIVSRLPENPIALPLLLVPEAEGYDDLPDRSAVLIALWKLAIAARKRAKAKIIAVTGSVGKTSSKEALALALSAYGSVHATSGNFNNHIGLPLTLAALPADADFAVLEMGMNHANEILPLSQLAKPDVALITNVDSVHAEFFDSIHDIARAKAEIFAGLAPGKVAVLPMDRPFYGILIEAAQAVGATLTMFSGLGKERRAEMADEMRERGVAVDDLPIGFTCEQALPSSSGTALTLDTPWGKKDIHIRAVGAHWSTTMLATLACLHALELNPEPGINALAQFRESPGRGRLQDVEVAGKRVTVIDDSYNASPVSMKAALRKLGMIARGENRRAVAVLGEMRELGKDGPWLHRQLAPVVKAEQVALVGACCPLMKQLLRALPWCLRWHSIYKADAESLRVAMEGKLRDGDIVLVKGSHGSNVYKIAEQWLKKPV